MDADKVLKALGLDEFATADEAVLALCEALRAAGYEPETIRPYEALAQSYARP